MLPEDLKARAEQHASSRGLSLGQLVRSCLEAGLNARFSPAADPLFTDRAVSSRDGPRDLAARHDDHLYGGEE